MSDGLRLLLIVVGSFAAFVAILWLVEVPAALSRRATRKRITDRLSARPDRNLDKHRAFDED